MKYNIVNTETGLKDGAYIRKASAARACSTLKRRYGALSWEVVGVSDTGWPNDAEFHAMPENAAKLKRLNRALITARKRWGLRIR